MNPAPRKLVALTCPQCGGGVQLRGDARTLNAVCPNCFSILDTTSPALQVLQTVKNRTTIEPKIPLGKRGTLRGTLFEHIGFQVRTTVIDGEHYSWTEYLLFNPYQGYRYLSEYDGHWNLIRSVPKLPRAFTSMGKAAEMLDGVKYRFFQRALAKTTYVMGEFPYQVRVGEEVISEDFVAPPFVLSSEKTDADVAWSRGEYVKPAEVWSGFAMPGAAPSAKGVYMNQPSPYGRLSGIWKMGLALLALLLTLYITSILLSRREVVHEQAYTFDSTSTGEASFVTPQFDLKGRPSTVEVRITTDLDNNWAYFNLALINDADGHAFDFGREVTYYYGRDSDGSYTEGSRSDRVLVPMVPAGRYYLRVEPEMSKEKPNSMHYTIRVRRDVPSSGYIWFGAFLLLIPPIYQSIRVANFEQKRWAESGGSSGSE